jgi:hypothetical protein
VGAPSPSSTDTGPSATAPATVPLWALGWWTALPFATVLGGLAGGRWLRWYWGPPVGFLGGALAWGLELARLPATPRERLADVLGAAEGVSGTVFLVLGPVLFGLVALVTSAAFAGLFRGALDGRRGEPMSEWTEPAGPAGPP